MNDLISIIVPIYKVEPYLRQCVDSILNQTYTNLEIILVDDGSPDNCGAICDEYATKDAHVKVIHKENGGLSDARNAGLDIATGEYYYFVDSDDYLPATSVEEMYAMLQAHDADMVIGGFERFSDRTGEVFFSTESDGLVTHVYNQEEAVKDFYRDGCQSWAVLYRRHVHQDIRFPKGEINEDEAIVFQLLERCSCVVVTNRVVYSYRNREESITTASFSEKKLAWVRHCRDNLLFIRERYPNLEKDAAARYRGSILWALREIALSEKAFINAQKELVAQLRDNKKRFDRISFRNKGELLTYWLLRAFPFGIYKSFLKLRHGERRS